MSKDVWIECCKIWKIWWQCQCEKMGQVSQGTAGKQYMRITDIQGRSQTLYTAPCNGVVSHGSQIWGLWVFAEHTHKNKCKTNAPMIFAGGAAFYACLSSRSDCSRCKWHTHLTNHGYFDCGKNPKPSNLRPMSCLKWCRFWDFPCVSVMRIEIESG